MANSTPTNPKTFWIDLETEGFTPKDCGILEAHVLIVDYHSLEIVAERGFTVKPYPGWTPYALKELDPFVYSMHNSSGLLEQVMRFGKTPVSVGLQIEAFANSHGIGRNNDRADPVCGNTVHFDRTFMKHYWPRLDRIFSHRIIDVSSEKETMRRYHPEWLAELDAMPERQVKAHRARDDIYASLNEFRFYRNKRGDI